MTGETAIVSWFEPVPGAERLPVRFPSPFDDLEPHPLALQAARALQERLRSGEIAPGVPATVLDRPEGGKMFGVLLIAAPDGRVGALRAFSAQLDGHWELPGWAPPLFDPTIRAVVEPGLERRVRELTTLRDRLVAGEEYRRERDERLRRDAGYADARADLRAASEQRRAERAERRAAVAAGDRPALRALDTESRLEDMERRERERALRDEFDAAGRPFRRLERRRRALDRLRRALSRRAMREIHDSYRLTNARGDSTTLRALFSPGEPPWGAADCAGPKLLTQAYRLGLRPLALAEFWWGPPPPGGGRVAGAFYPACRSKCGPLLPFLLDGLDVAPRRTWRPEAHDDDALVTRYEDDRFVAVVKPPGMLTVPARDLEVTDSLEARLRRRYPGAARLLVVHRLDLDTSGVVLVALDPEAYRFVQEQFVARTVRKRYVAWLDGEVAADSGTVRLPLRLDLDQRPRQVVDFVHGRDAITDWKVSERRDGRTRVAFFPRTGRTHQLRVHAAHPEGLGVPIVGDRLYGRPAARLLLHAESLTFRLPSGRTITVVEPAPF